MIEQILDYISVLNNEYREPQCFLVALMLKCEFGGEIYNDENHCVIAIDNIVYDKRGIVPINEIIEGSYLPIQKSGVHNQVALMNALIHKHK
nr:hypothetical protein [uncultured Allomuricauda sp.]